MPNGVPVSLYILDEKTGLWFNSMMN